MFFITVSCFFVVKVFSIKNIYIFLLHHPILIVFSPKQSHIFMLSKIVMILSIDMFLTGLINLNLIKWNYATKMYHISVPNHPILTIFSPPQSSMLILFGTVQTFPKGPTFGAACTVGTQ